MKNRLKSLLAFLGLVLLIIIVSLIPELVGGDIADVLKQMLGGKYYYVIGGIGLLTILAYTYWSDGSSFFSSKSKDISPEQVSQDNLQKIRTSLLGSYQQRIDSKLASRFPFNIEVTYSREGSPVKGHLYNKSLKISDLKKELIEIFDKQHGRLLIIGEPGAGKTTILLQLAIQLLARGEEQIPLIVNIATWRSRFASIEEWMEELLPQMGFSKALAQQMLRDNYLLPLFDGLDEVSKEERPLFLKAVASYGKNNHFRYVICSRIKEYTQTIDAAVYGQVVVKPLTLIQIEQGLKETPTPEANGLLYAIKKDDALATSLTAPFYLNTAQLLFASIKTWEEFEFTKNQPLIREQEIIESFVWESSTEFHEYSPIQVKKFLAFLANRMNRHNIIVLELISVQYHWCRLDKKQVLLRNLIAGLIGGLTGGLIGGVILSVIAGLLLGLVGMHAKTIVVGLVESMAIGLIGGILGGLIAGLFGIKAEIVTTGKFYWPFSQRKNSLKMILLFGTIICLLFGPDIGLIAGVVLGLVISVLYMLQNSQFYLKITHPYQRFYASMWSLYFSILQHFHLRRILYKKGLLPWRLLDFLNEATKNNILESDGGSWRFRHRILQDYFAKHWEDNYAATEDGVLKEEVEKA